MALFLICVLVDRKTRDDAPCVEIDLIPVVFIVIMEMQKKE